MDNRSRSYGRENNQDRGGSRAQGEQRPRQQSGTRRGRRRHRSRSYGRENNQGRGGSRAQGEQRPRQQSGTWREGRRHRSRSYDRENNQDSRAQGEQRPRQQSVTRRGGHNDRRGGNNRRDFSTRGRHQADNSRQGTNHNGNNDQSISQGRNNRSWNNHRPDKILGFKYVEDLLNNNDLQDVMFRLSNEASAFKNLLDKRDMTDDMIVNLVKLIKIVCTFEFQNVKTDILTSVLQSRFMEKLISYINGIKLQNPMQRDQNKYFWNDPDEFWNNLLSISKTVTETIPTHCETIQNLLSTVTTFLPLIEKKHSIHISDSIKEDADNLLEIVEKTIQDIQVKRQVLQVERRQGIIIDDMMEPPNDVLDIDIIPQAIEVTVDTSPFLRTNVVNKPYDSVDHYLDVQFRLLREDFIAPLRRGIRSYLDNDKKPKDVKIYKPVRFINVESVNECHCYRIQFDFSKKKQTLRLENSKTFMFGSLVCFTNDNFETVLFAKIVDRDEKLLKNSQLIIGFHDEVDIKYDSDYLMVESSVYFEPYYQVLGALQRMKRNTDSFPMEKYIIRVETDSLVPTYLQRHTYTIERRVFYPLRFPNHRFYNLNDSQLEAFKAALTKEFCIIQGPPGTGKTHLGLKIARTLIENNHAWFKNTPILVICYTNHALDQFLEGLLPVTQDILRVGGQSKNENLKDYNLTSKRLQFRKQKRDEQAIFKKRDEVRKYTKIIKTLNETRNRIADNDSVLRFTAFKDIEDYQNSWFATAKQDDIRRWLLEGAHDSGRQRTIRGHTSADEIQEGIDNIDLEDEDTEYFQDLDENEINEVNVDDLFDNITVSSDGSLVSLKHVQDYLKTLNTAMDELKNQPEDLNSMMQKEKIELEIWETESYLDYMTAQLATYKNATTPLRPLHVNLQNPFYMSSNDRWLLYFSWLDIYQVQLREKYERCDDQFKDVYRVYNELREMEDAQIMRQNLVVGMTTTGAARLHSSLKALRSPIVIVEEAAEVLEAHIVAALTDYCEHLILIGDHFQLKPGAADYRIETKYRLGVSLFERMVNNNIECHTLNIQHRMRPEISSLIKPHIYPNLEDHESTLQREPIFGIPKCLFFIDHNYKEDHCQDASKKNLHEAKFLIALARYLILNGYKPEQITILSAYLGQMFEMVREKRKPENKLLLQDVRISVLDNYQGEESDIILLSLVRSNSEDNAGFLKIQNRVCVALSRARNGFYLMGNMNLLLNSKSENQIWSNVYQTLQNQDAIGPCLTLRCQIHRYKYTQVSKSEDFNKVVGGGCDEPCAAELPCGHGCKRPCHIQDRDHNFNKCLEKCNRVLCNNPRHICRKECFKECGPCTYLVLRHLNCGHLVNLECHIDPDTYKCMEMVATKLPCDHQASKPCSIDANRFKCPHPCDTRVEPCGHACTRSCHVRVDPDHLEYNCTKPCAKPRLGCNSIDAPHICTRYCYQDCEDCLKQVRKHRSCGHVFTIPCNMDVELDMECTKPCKKALPCGHQCKNKCLEICGPCEVMVEKVLPVCGHKIKIKCREYPDRKYCESRTCPRVLPCGHKCTNSCKSECTQQCTELVDCNIQSLCGHKITKIQCYLKYSDSSELIKHCNNPCNVELACKHRCSGTCGECLQSRIHKRCGEKCGVPLVCNHECPIPCREACKPCTRKCEMKCEHSKCKKNCGEPCTPCTNPCSRHCEHVHCKKPCGEVCDVPPCTQRCRKLLRCKHPCVGFCNDPCPILCKICNNDELTEIFLGSEDDPDAIYVMLNDCGHIFESSDLDEWLNQNKQEIKFKVCPKCSTNITTTARYSDHIKRALHDVILAKEKSFGVRRANETFRAQLLDELVVLKQTCPQQLYLTCVKLGESIEMLETRLQPVVGRRRQPINNIELNAIKSKLQTLTYILECFGDGKHTYARNDASIVHLNALLEVLLRSVDHVTDQEIADLELEIKRLHRIVQYDKIQKSSNYAPTKETLITQRRIEQYIFINQRFTEVTDFIIKGRLTAWAKELKTSFSISDKERMDIVKAMGLAKGHWFKCPNGHPYVIGECGGAMQVAKCFCGAAIGGTDHHLLGSNQFAGEMDGAQRHAWPGGLH